MTDRDSLTDSLDELEDFSDSGSDFEATLKPPKRKKQALNGPKPPKRPRRHAASRVAPNPRSGPAASLQPQPQPPPCSSGTSSQESSQEISAKDIYDAVISGKSAMATVVDEWLDSYKRSREAGLLVLVNFIVQACGCKGVVSPEMFSSMENAEIISRLTREFNEDSVEYPLCAAGPQLRRFKAGLFEFVKETVRCCQNSLVYDEYLFPTLLALLTGLSDSQVRAFRHTSTLLAMKLMTGLVKVAVVVSVQLQTAQRRLDAENSKSASERAANRLEELRATVSQLRENQEELSSMMNATFRGVFVHRYRDQLPDIRAACIEELGVWLRLDPEDFLNDGCLKYLGWTLHDKQSPVRLQCVRALQALYQQDEFIGRLELFTSRFKERMLSMVLDKDPDVAVEGVNLLLLIQQRTEEGLREDECGNIYPLVYASHRGLSSAAGTFLYNKLKNVIDSDDEPATGKRSSVHFFQILVSFHIQSEFHEHGAYLVDSLWGVAGAELREWDLMTNLLLQESELLYEEEGALIELMMCAMRQASQGTPPVGRTQGRKAATLTQKEKKMQEQDRRRITAHFIPLLPQLLAKYSADAVNVSCLLRAPLYFDLEIYSSAQVLEKHLDLLLAQICGVIEKHTDDAVLEACARVIGALCSDRYTFSSRAHRVFGQLMDRLSERFSLYLNDLLQGSADEDDEAYSAATALTRMAALSCAKDPTGWKLLDSCLELLKNRLETRELDTELMVAALRCAAMHLMWAKVNAVASTPPEVELKHQRRGVRLFCRLCQDCLSLEQPEIRNQAFELLCDLLLLYSAGSLRSSPALQTLAYLPSDTLRSELAAFLLDFIFTESDGEEEDETMIRVLQKKRNQLAGYCKLVIYGVLDLTAATSVFKHYSSQFFNDFGDIIKETVNRTKLISPIQSAKTVGLSLQQLFSEMLTEDHSRQDLAQIRDLAKRLAMSFGIDLHRARKPLVALHIAGIRFALRESQEEEGAYPNLDFLEILAEFAFKLLPPDRAKLAELLESQCPSAALCWPAVRMYRRSLEARTSSRSKERRGEEEEGRDAASVQDTPLPKRKRTTAPSSASSTTRGSWLDSSSIHSRLRTPTLTSTVQRPPPTTATGRAAEPDVDGTLTEVESEDEFSSGVQMRKVQQRKRQQLSSGRTPPTAEDQDLNSTLDLLSLMDKDKAEPEEPEIQDYESNSENESGYTIPSTHHTSVSVLDELFD